MCCALMAPAHSRHPPAHSPPRGNALQALDRLLCCWDIEAAAAPGSAEACLAEVEDALSYCNDVLCAGESMRPAAERRP
jgi:hypothetical protein